MGKRVRPPKTDGKQIGDTGASSSEGLTEKTIQPETVSTPKAIAKEDTTDLEQNTSILQLQIPDAEPKKSYAEEDIIEPGKYWDSALVCCILGTNPPLEIAKGFLSRIWKSYQIDDISFHKDSQFIVRFQKEVDRDEIIKQKYYFMDDRPVYVQKWYPGVKVNLLELKDIPIWVQFSDLDMKYWSLSGLRRLGSAIGQPVKRDKATSSRWKWSYARIQLEVQVNQKFPEHINFTNEEGRIITQNVTYEWIPTLCNHCNRIGHVQENCRRKLNPKEGNQKRKKFVWKAKTAPETDLGVKNKDHKEEVEEMVQPETVKLQEELMEGTLEPYNIDEEKFTEVWGKKAARRISLEGKEFDYIVEREILDITDQSIHCHGRFVGDNKDFLLTLIYAHNDPHKRKELWDKLNKLSSSTAWCIMGDFNTVLHLDERIGGNPVSWEEIKEFQQCLSRCGLEDLPYEGPKFTWNNNQGTGKRIYSKLDRVMSNLDWINKFDLKAHLKESCVSDCSPMCLHQIGQIKHAHNFKYCDMWSLDPQFSDIVANVWDQEHTGYPMYQIFQKLKSLKQPLKSLNKRKFQHLETQIDILRARLHSTQEAIRSQSPSESLLET
ncbi:hypothetical protein DM860_017598 [Cuscuta australis]|uniref:DUF4283 domain-containing protein n=1 Tax=Cuscuta australis TaxID=267555 RepID=A0A328DD18_9ASTE|nr:hypothetical protein DM860_017598 [Cuscuta australis]